MPVIPAEIGRSMATGQPGQNKKKQNRKTDLKITWNKKDLRCASNRVLPSKHEALSSNSSTAEKKKKKKNLPKTKY
jgi:hypothetical protein